MPAKTKKISADEAQAKRKDHVRETDHGSAIVKATKAPTSWDKEARSARFVMSTQSMDRYGDIVVTEGIDTTEFERNPVGLLFHNSRTWPVANWANLEKILKGRPPRMEGDFVLLPAGGPVKEIEETEWMIANGGIRACSIGFIPNWDAVEMILDDDERWTGGLRWVESELVECSCVPVPAAPGALLKHANGNMRLAKELIEDILDNWQRTPEGLLMPRADYEKAYRLTVEKLSPVKPAATEPELPLSADDAEAKNRQLALEVAKACALPIATVITTDVDGRVAGLKVMNDVMEEGRSVALEGEFSGKFVVEGGAWKRARQLADDDVVNQVVTCKKADDAATVFEVAKPYSKAGWTRDDKGEWVEIKVVKVLTVNVRGASTATTSDGSSVTTLEQTEIAGDTDADADADAGRMRSFIDALREKCAELFGTAAAEIDRIDATTRSEPTFDVPPLPSAEAIAAAKTKASEMRTRLKAAGRI